MSYISILTYYFGRDGLYYPVAKSMFHFSEMSSLIWKLKFKWILVCCFHYSLTIFFTRSGSDVPYLKLIALQLFIFLKLVNILCFKVDALKCMKQLIWYIWCVNNPLMARVQFMRLSNKVNTDSNARKSLQIMLKIWKSLDGNLRPLLDSFLKQRHDTKNGHWTQFLYESRLYHIY